MATTIENEVTIAGQVVTGPTINVTLQGGPAGPPATLGAELEAFAGLASVLAAFTTGRPADDGKKYDFVFSYVSGVPQVGWEERGTSPPPPPTGGTPLGLLLALTTA